MTSLALEEVVAPFIYATYNVRDKILPAFSEISEIIYRPPQALMAMTELGESVCSMFVAMHLALFLSFQISLIKDPWRRKMFSTIAGLCVGFYYHGLTNFVHIL